MLNHLHPAFLQSQGKKCVPRCFCRQRILLKQGEKGVGQFECSKLFVSVGEEPFLPLTTEIRTSQQETTDIFPTTSVYPVGQTEISFPLTTRCLRRMDSLSRSTSSKSSASGGFVKVSSCPPNLWFFFFAKNSLLFFSWKLFRNMFDETDDFEL
ncbi:hypothetical protein CDAR_412781 [Caerostris darwini]|uniref:Uncharacterized protein n=1 Tax=Caerostris darwini TaxID=1538125 RepID=A0AAV4SF05_9ARAC|nr:hypothetical protein CDAR_412781 [Caerostris darwini]